MSHGTCPKAGCTVGESGICLMSHTPATACPNFPQNKEEAAGEKLSSETDSPETSEPDGATSTRSGSKERHFHIGLELGIDDALEISRGRYCHLIGILGASDAGKTCCLLSLYLSVLHGRLPSGYRFAGSLTLKGFEDRARRLREWKHGPLPTQLANHTVLGNPRAAALLHLAIRQGSTGRQVDLLLTDLPGEWSKALVDRASTADRLTFLQRADGIIIVIDGKRLESNERNIEVIRTKHLFERLKNNVGIDSKIPIILLVSKGDEIDMRLPPEANEIVQHAKTLGFTVEPIVAAAFSYNQRFESGTGVFEAIERLIETRDVSQQVAPETPLTNIRRFSAFREVRL
jgi:hypothetical protein